MDVEFQHKEAVYFKMPPNSTMVGSRLESSHPAVNCRLIHVLCTSAAFSGPSLGEENLCSIDRRGCNDKILHLQGDLADRTLYMISYSQ